MNYANDSEKKILSVTSYTRLHFGLICLNSKNYRIDGGSGLLTEIPSATIDFYHGTTNSLTINNPIYDRIFSKYKSSLPYNIRINTIINQHCGLGTTTQIALSIYSALNYLNHNPLHYDKKVFDVGRGGTSGIGIHSYNNGGFVIDGGHIWGSEKSTISPSNANTDLLSISPLLFHCNFPNWKIVVIIPRHGKIISGNEERQFFQDNTPVDQKEIDHICKCLLMGVIPSLLTSDFLLFTESIEDSMHYGFNRKEILI